MYRKFCDPPWARVLFVGTREAGLVQRTLSRFRRHNSRLTPHTSHLTLHASRLLFVVLFGQLLTGCAVANRDNTLLLNQLDEMVQPETTWERVALAPVMIPAATGALVVDGFIIHPARVVPQAADDVYELYWEPREETLFRRSLLFVPRILLTPPTFVGAWHLRATYDIDDWN